MITATPGMAPVITGSFMVFPEAALHKAASGGIVKICSSVLCACKQAYAQSVALHGILSPCVIRNPFGLAHVGLSPYESIVCFMRLKASLRA